MATTKSIVTRIKNKVDTLAAWQSYTGTLLDGEIAIVRVATGETYLNPVTNQDEPVVELLMKVGDGSTPFAQLPWLSAKASDVYGWAKLPDASEVEVQYNSGTEAAPSFIKASLADVLKGVKDNAAGISALGTSKLADITVTSTGSGVVQSVAKDGVGGVKVTLGAVQEGDIASNAVTNDKLADGAVKNAEVASDAAIDATKLYYATDKVTVAAKLATLSSSVASLQGNVLSALTIDPVSAGTGVVQGIAYANGKFTVTYGTVATADITDSAVTTAKINDAAVTTAKIADGAVTNAKLGADISSDKINVGTSTTTGTLSAKIKAMDALIAGKMDTHDHPYAAAGHNHDSVYIKPADVDSKINTALGSVLKYKGTKTSTSNLPKTDNVTGDVWNISSKCAANGTLPAVNAGDNVAWNGTAWDVLAGTVDLSNYYTKTEVGSELAKKANATITAGATGDGVVVLTGTNGNNGVSYSASHADSGVAAGTYTIVTVDAKGHVTAGTNPTTLEDFGITDAYTKTEVYTKSEVAAELAKKSDTGHTHAAYVNKNAFGNIKVIKSGGGTTATDVTVAADTTTDTVEFEGSNVTITGTNGTGSTADKITFAVANGTTKAKGIVQLSDATDIPTNKTGSETAATTKAVAAAMDAAEEADAKATEALEAAGHDHPYAADDHGHGKIDKDGKITGTALSSASGLLAYDSNGLIQKVTAAAARTAIGAGTSSLTIGTTASTAAAGNHTHSSYATDIANIHSSYARIGTVGSGVNAKNYLYNGKDGTDILIFDCGGASDI